MKFADEMLRLFVENYALIYPVELPFMGMCDIDGGIVTEAVQPTASPWLRFSYTTGSTINATIGTINDIKKRSPFDVNIQIMLPRTTIRTNTGIFTYSVAENIESALDEFMITNGLMFDSNTKLIYSEQSEPKFTAMSRPTSDDTWVITTVSYQYILEYV